MKLNISEPESLKSQQKSRTGFQHPLFELLFRTHFLLAALGVIVNVALWGLHLSGFEPINFTGLSPVVWHTNAMIFGFAATVAVGFILTAVQTWTGQASLSGKPVVGLCVLWLSSQAALSVNSVESIVVVILCQLMWWLMVVLSFSRLVIRSNNRRNYIFIGILTVMATFNILMLSTELMGYTPFALHIAKSMILVFCLLMGVVGGRVIPFFTMRGANTQPINTPAYLDSALLMVSIIGISFYVISYFELIAISPAVFMLSAAILHLWRLTNWRCLATVKYPLLWSLHLSYFFMALGLGLWACSYANFIPNLTPSNGIHLITLGAIGLMILAMMSRISLGHTGRALSAHPLINVAFIALALAAIIRAFLPLISWVVPAWYLSIVLWILAFTIFIFIYWPILTAPRQSR